MTSEATALPTEPHNHSPKQTYVGTNLIDVKCYNAQKMYPIRNLNREIDDNDESEKV